MAVQVTRDGRCVAALLGVVEGWDGRLVRGTPEQHDRTTAAVQALTHTVLLRGGHAPAESGVGVEQLTALAPPPPLTLTALLGRVLGGSPEGHGEIQRANAYAGSAPSRLDEPLLDTLRRRTDRRARIERHKVRHDLPVVQPGRIRPVGGGRGRRLPGASTPAFW
ncbi:prephenate dehydrogenase dimerization domain-containing protein [Micromonospora echinospora]